MFVSPFLRMRSISGMTPDNENKQYDQEKEVRDDLAEKNVHTVSIYEIIRIKLRYFS